MIKTLLLYPFIIFFFSPVISFSQEDDINLFYTKNGFVNSDLSLLGHCNIEYYYLKSDSMLVFKSKYDAKKFIDTTAASFPMRFDEIDFSKNTLVLFSYHGGDCHAKFKYYPVNNEYSKIFTVCVDVFYGGCRAGGNFMTTWGLIPKLPDDYKINFATYFVDRAR